MVSEGLAAEWEMSRAQRASAVEREGSFVIWSWAGRWGGTVRERGRVRRTAVDTDREDGIPERMTGCFRIPVPVRFRHRGAVHAVVCFEAAGYAEVAAIALAVADDVGGCQ